MYRANVQSSQFPQQLLLWQARLARIPRWAWAVIGIAVAVPVVLFILAFAVIAVTVGVALLAIVLGVITVRNVFHRLAGDKTQVQLARRDPFTSRDTIVVERIDNLTNP